MKYMTLDFDLWPWNQGHKISIFYLACYCDYSVQILTISVKPFRIYSKIKYFWHLTLDSNLWPWDQGHQISIFYLACYCDYSVQILTILINPFKIYSKMKYFTLYFDLWPWILTFDLGIKVTKFLNFI